MIVFTQLGNIGRLGNQFFQIAATVAHASRMKVDAGFPKWEYNKYFTNKIPDNLNMEFDEIFNGVEHEIYFHAQPTWFKKIPDNQNLILHGFFQSEKYFSDKRELVANYFKPKPEFMQVVRTAGKEWLNLQNTCAIHIRRTDYRDFKNGMIVLDIDYYLQAMNKLNKKIGEVNYIIFSDDIDWCKQQLAFGKCYFSENNSEMVDLYLMAQCKNHIIANSTFSWWGAWLSKYLFKNQGTTIAPKVWGDSSRKIDRKDIYCPDWIVI